MNNSNNQKSPRADPSKRCFVISPIGDKESPARKHADKVLRNLIVPALADLDLDPVRSDKISEHGLISVKMFEELLDDALCIAVLTGANPNVMYEVAVAQCASRPLVLLIEEGHEAPFDLKDHRAIEYSFDVDRIRQSHTDLVNYAQQAMAFPTNPLEAYGFPTQKKVALKRDFFRSISDVENEFSTDGIFGLWSDSEDHDVPDLWYLLQIAEQKLLFASTQIGPWSVESANLWVCHSVDQSGRPKLLRSGMRHGYFPFDQLLSSVLIKSAVYYRPIELNYDSDQDLSVAAKVVLTGVPEIQSISTSGFNSDSERKLGTKTILGIPVQDKPGKDLTGTIGQPMCITVDFVDEISDTEREAVLERAGQIQGLLGRVAKWSRIKQ